MLQNSLKMLENKNELVLGNILNYSLQMIVLFDQFSFKKGNFFPSSKILAIKIL